MRRNKFDVTVGRSIFNDLERKVEKGGTSFNIFAEEKASDLLAQSPYFVDELRNHRLLKEGESHSKYIFVFRSNLACQRFGVMRGKPELLVTKYAADRAKALVEYLLRNKPEMVKEHKRRGISHYVMYYAFRDIFLKDSLQTDYIAGVPLKEETEVVAGIAVNKRLVKSSKQYGEMLKIIGVNPKDDSELKDVVREVNFREIVLDHYKDDPFYSRRDNAIVSKRVSVTDSYTANDFNVETGALFSGNNVNSSQEITEKVFINLVDSLGLNRERLASMLVS